MTERVRHILMGLFHQALSEYGREAPALTDIMIERASERFEPRLVVQLSDGHRVSVPVRAADFYAFCERHSTWNLESLRCALLREGQEIYAHMVESHVAEVCTREREHRSSRHSHGERRSEIRNVRNDELRQGDARRRMRDWLGQRWNLLSTIGAAGTHGRIANREAQARGVELLRENLSPTQRDQYEKRRCFEVIGGETGKRYRIQHGYQMNVEELDKIGRRVRLLCFMPKGRLVIGDVMLAQKMALELFESEALKVANKIQNQYSRLGPIG